jgi:hypothetical protein
MKKYVILIAFALYLVFCKKESKYDFRNDYEGNYIFTIHHFTGNFMYGNDWDTTYTKNGFVLKTGDFKNSLIEIHYETDTIAIYNDKILTENTEFILTSSGTLSYPGGFGDPVRNTWAYGYFTDHSTLQLYLSIGTSHYWNKREITAHKQ